MNVIKYPSIGQFRNLVKSARLLGSPLAPTLVMQGTVKVHGTNASILFDTDGNQYPQSRNNILTLDNDNLGFAKWHDSRRAIFSAFYQQIKQDNTIDDDCLLVIYGEFAGKGVQRKVAVSNLERFLYVFGVMLVKPNGDEFWLSHYPVLEYGTEVIDSRSIWHKTLTIDFNKPDQVQNDLVNITHEVEQECPVGKYFGVTGLGEGVVWSYITDKGELLACKVKGEKHSVTKVKKLASVNIEKVNSIHAFIDYAVTENRLEQGFFEVCNNEADIKLTGDLIRWVVQDIQKEESDTLEANGLTIQDIGKPLSLRVKQWFFERPV